MIGIGIGMGMTRGVGAVVQQVTYGALSRAQPGAGIATTATTILEGDPSGHWQIGSGRLYPTTTGDTADMNAGPYLLVLDNGDRLNITIEPNTWDVATQSEWDFVSLQSSGTLAGKKIALRNDTALDFKITGVAGTAFRRVDLRSGGNPLVIEGRFGAVGDWASYCEFNRVQTLRGARGITFKHLRTTASADTKILLVGEAANVIDDITVDDCWLTGQVADPFGNYTTSTNYPNFGVSLVSTAGSATGSVGNVTIRNSLIEWGAVNVNVTVSLVGSPARTLTVTGNEIRFMYEDGIKTSGRGNPVVITDNYIHSPIGLPSDSLALHPDAIQLIGAPTATTDWTGITIARNVILGANSQSRGVMQGIFLDDMKTGAGDSGFFFVATIEDNLVVNNVIQGVWILQAKNCVVRRNTAVAWDQAAVNATGFALGAGSANATDGGGNSLTDNIGDGGLTTGVDNNVLTGRNGTTIAYSTLFAGPTFAPITRSQAVAQFSPLPAANGAGADL